MARKRLISPEFFQHGPLFDAEVASGLPLRLAFAGLWCQADREGRFRFRPRELKLGVLPYDEIDFGAVLSALQTYGFIESYVVDGEAFAYIPSFRLWQTFHPNEKASILPEPTIGRHEPTIGRLNPSVTVTVTGTVTDTSGQISETAPEPTPKPAPLAVQETPLGAEGPFEAFWEVYPKRAGGNSKVEAKRAWKARRNAGVAAEDLLAGCLRYRAYCDAMGMTGGRFVKQASSFLGPSEHWTEDWTPDRPVDPLDAELLALAEQSRPEAYVNADAVRVWESAQGAANGTRPLSPFGVRSGLESASTAQDGASAGTLL